MVFRVREFYKAEREYYVNLDISKVTEHSRYLPSKHLSLVLI